MCFDPDRIAVLLLPLLFVYVAASGQRSPVEVGDSLYARFENVKALEAYRKALERDSSFTVMYKLAVAANEVALDLQAEGRRDQAEDKFQEAVRYAEEVRDAYPSRAGSWFVLAATTGKLAQFAGGRTKVKIGRSIEEYYKKSLSLDSTFALAYLVGGIFNREVAQLSWLQKLAAKALFGGIPDASLENSRRLLEKALELDSTLFMAHWELAQTYRALGEPEKAQPHLRFLTVLSPRSSEEARIRARVRESLKESTTTDE